MAQLMRNGMGRRLVLSWGMIEVAVLLGNHNVSLELTQPSMRRCWLYAVAASSEET
ncbi:UNVERIFIED_CONTAM: hypothetical protein Sangu_1917000 [Sesamum angustifolium]|uniref:Uncharacterized protein n=1 Tax=Sesamum angustifolium TaxID=2727405 RepID=A0AAW2LXR9_9LAMI